MGRITQETKDRIRTEVSFADLLSKYTRPQKQNQASRGMWFCPFHNDVRNASMSVDADRQVWHCFTCQEGGDIFKFVMQKEGYSFTEAVEFLCEQYGIELLTDNNNQQMNKKSLFDVVKEANLFFQRSLIENPIALEYLKKRKFTEETIQKWEIGYAPGQGLMKKHLLSKGFSVEEIKEAQLITNNPNAYDFFYNRIMFPIHNTTGRVVAFTGRVLDNSNPKYLNSVDYSLFHKRSIIFGLDKARKHIAKQNAVIVTEGQVDVIMNHQAGLENSVAALGTAFTKEHLLILARMAKTIYLCLDNDEAGVSAARRVADIIDEEIDSSLFVLVLPKIPLYDKDGRQLLDSHGKPLVVKDPDDFFNRAEKSKEDYIDLLKTAPGLFSFVIKAILSDCINEDTGNKEHAYRQATAFLKKKANVLSFIQLINVAEIIINTLGIALTPHELLKNIGIKTASSIPETQPIKPITVKFNNSATCSRNIEELNTIRLLLDNPKKHAVFNRTLNAAMFSNPINYEIYISILKTIQSLGSLDDLSFDSVETSAAWAEFLATRPPTNLDERRAEAAITRTLNTLKKNYLKDLLKEISNQEDPDYDKISELKFELLKL